MNLMLDLETLGRDDSAIVLSIGAVLFDWNTTIGPAFSATLTADDQQRLGRTIDADTVLWWLGQGETPRTAVLTRPTPTYAVLEQFAAFWAQHEPRTVWGNGADFDCVILASLYRSFDLPCPFQFWQHRCYRTLKGLRPDVRAPRTDTMHVAVEDAHRQAYHAIQLGQAIGGLE